MELVFAPMHRVGWAAVTNVILCEFMAGFILVCNTKTWLGNWEDLNLPLICPQTTVFSITLGLMDGEEV